MNLFYAEKERILFYIAGYADNTDNVEQIIQKLNEGADKLVEISFEDKENVGTFVVTKSRRYKNMRVFYAKTDNIPDAAFKITGDWTMIKWLED